MKKSITLVTFLVTAFLSTAQQTVESLKKELSSSKAESTKLKDENKFLKEKLSFCTTLGSDTTVWVKSFSSFYNFTILSCKGNRANQSVEIIVMVEQSSTNQSLTLRYDGATVIDVLGKNYRINETQQRDGVAVYTDVPVRLTFNVSNILPGTDMFKLISVPMGTTSLGNYQAPSSYTEIKNLKIVW